MEAIARFRNCPMSERKMRLVVNNIRGKNANKVLDMLKFTRQEAGRWLEKIVTSAISNWKVKAKEEPDNYELYIKTIFVGQGPQLKRMRPAPMGRGHRIRKHTNHITIVLENRLPLKERAYNN